MQNDEIYVCRRCENHPRFRNYNMLRAHLRAQHRIVQLANSEVSMYEVYPGSRFTQPPFADAGPIASNNVDQLIDFRDVMVQAVSDSIAQGFSAQPPPQINMGDAIERIVEMHRMMTENIANTIEAGVRSAVSGLVHKLQSTDGNSSDVDLQIPAATTDVNIEPKGSSETPPSKSPVKLGQDIQITCPDGVNNIEDPPTSMENEASMSSPNCDKTQRKMVGSTVNVFYGMPSLVRTGERTEKAIVPDDTIVDVEPLAQSTQKIDVPVSSSHTTSDDELMTIELPTENVTVSQIINELRNEAGTPIPDINTDNIPLPVPMDDQSEAEKNTTDQDSEDGNSSKPNTVVDLTTPPVDKSKKKKKTGRKAQLKNPFNKGG